MKRPSFGLRALILVSGFAAACLHSRNNAAHGGFSGTVVRGPETLDLELVNTSDPEDSHVRLVGTLRPLDRQGRPVHVVMDLDVSSVPEGESVVPLTVLDPPRSTRPPGGYLEARLIEIDPDRPNGAGLMFPSAVASAPDGYQVTGTARVTLQRNVPIEPSSSRSPVTQADVVRGWIDASFIAADGTTRRISGRFGTNAAANEVDAGPAPDGFVPPLPPDAAARDAAIGDTAQTDAAVSDAATPLPFCGSTGATRSCGLQRDPAMRTCTPGTRISVGCHSGCALALGSCSGDAVLQVCPSTFTTLPCGSAALASNDDAPSGAPLSCSAMGSSPESQQYCPATTFVCPADGRFTVWFGSYSESRPAFACTIGTSP